MARNKQFWIETTDTTFLYYEVKAASKDQALDKFLADEGVYVGCNDECNEHTHQVLEEKPYITWQ